MFSDGSYRQTETEDDYNENGYGADRADRDVRDKVLSHGSARGRYSCSRRG